MTATLTAPASFLPRFGLTSFRPGQEEVIAAVMAGADCLCIMPTGGGKSLCYQLPAVARGGLTLVVSPLIALMKDQVDQLQQRGIAATYINSSLVPAEQIDRMNRMEAGEYSLVYIAPERLRNSRFLESLRNVKVSLLAVDEAHCISEWGHDFRPDYSRLGKFRRKLGQPQTIALTATATADVRKDVTAQLELRQPRVFISGFARPNLHFEVWPVGGKNDKEEQLIEFLREQNHAGIIYAATRKKCEELVGLIKLELRRRVGFYHAGLPADERRHVQEAFMSGQTPLLVATNAFGMGVDKSDLRFVVHYDIPGSIEAYYQEAGRAGRDGLPSRCLLLFSEQDRYLREFFIDNAYPPREMVAKIYDYLRGLDDDPIEVTQEELKDRLKLTAGNEAVSVSERLLEKAGVLERLDSRENMASVRIDSDLPSLVDLVPVDAKVRRKVLLGVEKIVGEQRRERVYFNPAKLAATLELDVTALNRAFKELCKLQAFDFVPPFRGRAIHMLERDRPFAKLEIDFAELDRRKAAEYAKLEEMITYARGRGCRQKFILDYFGDVGKGKCGLCDSCGGIPAAGATVTPAADDGDEETAEAIADVPTKKPAGSSLPDRHADVREAARMALAGVARTKGKVGKGLVVQMLCGSQSKEVAKRRFDQLSTFGILSFLTQPEATEFLDALQNCRLLDQVENEKFRPLMVLTALGEQVMRNEQPVPASFFLAEKLRKKIAGNIPAAAATPLSRPPRDRPLPEGEVAPVVGTLRVPSESSRGPDGTRSVPTTENAPAPAPAPTPTPALPLSSRPDFHWTWLLLDRGFLPAECQAIRRLTESEYLQQLQRAASEYYHVKWEWGLTAAQYTACATAAKEHDGRSPLALVSPPAGLKREQWEFYLALRSLAEEQE